MVASMFTGCGNKAADNSSAAGNSAADNSAAESTNDAAADVFVFADDQVNDLVNAGALQEVAAT